MSVNVVFNSVDLQTSSIITQKSTHYNIPTKDMPVYPLAHANKSASPNNPNYPNRKIIIEGKLRASTISALETLIDTFKAYFNVEDANLDIDWAGGTRRFVATGTPDVKSERGLNTADFSVVFDCDYPFGEDTSSTSLVSASGSTGATRGDSITVAGSAKYQLPIITITINSLTDGTDSYMTVSNNANGQGITILGDFAASDEIVIDCETRTVTINGTEVDYVGSFPEFETGSQQINYADGFTARNIDYDVDYTKRYL